MVSPVRTLQKLPFSLMWAMEKGAMPGLLAELVNLGWTHVPEGLTPWEGPMWKNCEELQPVGRTQVGKVPEGLSHGRDPTLALGETMRSLPPKEEEAAETTCGELTTTPIPHLPATLGKEETGRRKEWWEGVSNFGLISYCPALLYLE